MNLDARPTPEELRALLRARDDRAGRHLLWVKRTGDVELSRIPPERTLVEFEQDHPEMQMRYEPFLAGNEYVGPEAADDQEWVAELFTSLIREWLEAREKTTVTLVEPFC